MPLPADGMRNVSTWRAVDSEIDCNGPIRYAGISIPQNIRFDLKETDSSDTRLGAMISVGNFPLERDNQMN